VSRRPADAFLRLKWAYDHFERLLAEIDWWAAAHPYLFITERDAQGWTVVYAKPIDEPPFKLGLLIGDVLHNLRACLDNLALSLCQRNSGPLTEGQMLACYFPICETPEKFNSSCASALPNIGAEPRAIIERAQPYDGSNSGQLLALRKLSDHDKHRRVPVVAKCVHLSATGMLAEAPSDLRGLRFPRSFEGKTQLLRGLGFPEDADAEVDMNLSLTLDIAFAEGAPDEVALSVVRDVLGALLGFVVAEVVAPLESFI
jgi:hypothetical protein